MKEEQRVRNEAEGWRAVPDQSVRPVMVGWHLASSPLELVLCQAFLLSLAGLLWMWGEAWSPLVRMVFPDP